MVTVPPGARQSSNVQHTYCQPSDVIRVIYGNHPGHCTTRLIKGEVPFSLTIGLLANPQ